MTAAGAMVHEVGAVAVVGEHVAPPPPLAPELDPELELDPDPLELDPDPELVDPELDPEPPELVTPELDPELEPDELPELDPDDDDVPASLSNPGFALLLHAAAAHPTAASRHKGALQNFTDIASSFSGKQIP